MRKRQEEVEIDKLKVDQKKSVEKLGKIVGTYILKNEKLQEVIDKQSVKAYELMDALSKAEGKLETIRQWREKHKDTAGVGVWAMSELGVLLKGDKKK